MRISILLISLFALIAQAHGRVGESLKQIEARYGKPQAVLKGGHGSYQNLGFSFHGFMIGVEFLDGVSKREFFMRPSQPKLSTRDIQEILALGAGNGLTWKPLEGPWKNVLHPKQGERYWLRSDTNVFAMLPAEGNSLMITEMGFKTPKT